MPRPDPFPFYYNKNIAIYSFLWYDIRDRRNGGKIMDIQTVRLADIRVLPFFKACPPRAQKLAAKKAHYESKGAYDRILVLDSRRYLLDGYATYLAMLGNGETTAEAKIVGRFWPVVHGRSDDGSMDFYGVPERLARTCGPGDRLLLFARGRFRTVTAESLGVMSGEPAWPAWGFRIRRVHKRYEEKR